MEHPFRAQHTSRPACPAQERVLLPAQGPELPPSPAEIAVHDLCAQHSWDLELGGVLEPGTRLVRPWQMCHTCSQELSRAVTCFQSQGCSSPSIHK